MNIEGKSPVLDYCIRYKKKTKVSRIINVFMAAVVVTTVFYKKGR